VLNKSAKTITGVIVALAAYGISAIPAQAEPVSAKQDVLISQLAGHNTYMKQDQLLWKNYAVGRVRGKVGNILMIEFLKYGAFPGYIDLGNGNKMTHLHIEGAAEPGDDIIVRPRFSNGKYVGWDFIDAKYIQTFVSQANPYWVTRLKIKEIPVVEKSAINFESSAPVSLPPVQPSAAPVYQPAPTPAPIRGMW
jgi:hypothetical protein